MSIDTARIIFLQIIILLTYIMVYGIMFQDYQRSNSILFKISFGFLSGFVCIAIMFLNHFYTIESDYRIIVKTLNILFIVSVVLFSGFIPVIMTVSFILLTRFFLQDIDSTKNIVIFSFIVVCYVLRVLYKYLKLSNLKQWFVTMFFIELAFVGSIIYQNYSILSIVIYILFMLFIQLFSLFMYIRIESFNVRFNEYHHSCKVDYVSHIYSYSILEKKFHEFIEYKQNIFLSYITIENYKTLKSKFKYSLFNDLLGEIGQLILFYVKGNGLVGKINNDEYCLVFSDKFKNLDELTNKICEGIETIYNYHAKKNNVDIKLKLTKNLICSRDIYQNLANHSLADLQHIKD